MLDALIEMLDREPFQPFRIVMTSGERYEIVNPHLVATGQTHITVYAPRSDRFTILRLNQLTALEVMGRAA